MAILGLMPMIAIALTVLQAAVTHDDFAQARAAFQEDRAARYEDERANFLHMRSTMGDQLPAAARDLTKSEFASGRNFFGGSDKVVTKRYDARIHVPETAGLLAAAIALISFVLGAVGIGKDWATGAMGGLLVWQPRRAEVLLAKLGVLLPPLLIAGAGSFVLVWSGGVVDGSLRGTTQGLTASWWIDQVWFAVRAGGVAWICAVIGASSADLARGASVPLGLVVAAVVLNPVIGGMAPSLRPWMPMSLIETTFDWGQQFRRFNGTELVGSVWVPGKAALAILVLATTALVAAAVVVRQRRDVV